MPAKGTPFNPPLTIAVYGSVSMVRAVPCSIRVDMPPLRQETTKRSHDAALRMLALATVAGWAMTVPALAQDMGGLRGGIDTQSNAGDAADLAPQPDDTAAGSAADAAPAPAAPAPAAEEPAKPRAATDEVTTGTVREPTVDSPENEPLDPGAQRVTAIESLDRSRDENPYAPTGIRWGSFILKPSLETGITATSNADSSADGSDAILSENTLRLNAASDWANHSATIDAFGTFRKTLSGQEVEDVTGGVNAALELELGNDYRARGTLDYSIAPESASSPVVIVNAAEEPIRQTLGGTLGLEKDAGKARFAVTGVVSHDAYGDADLIGGGTLSQKDRDSTLYSLRLRTGYQVSPALTPFVEAEIGREIYDQEVDSAGYRRSSDQYAFRGGLAFDRGEKFSGEVAVGWTRENFDDLRLEPLSAASVQADILWSPVRETNIRFTGATTLEGTTTPGESGSVLYSTRIGIERRMRANLTGVASLGMAWRDYSGSDPNETIVDAEASLTWWLNRYAGIVGRVRHENVSSDGPGSDTETNSIFLGLKLQR